MAQELAVQSRNTSLQENARKDMAGGSVIENMINEPMPLSGRGGGGVGLAAWRKSIANALKSNYG